MYITLVGDLTRLFSQCMIHPQLARNAISILFQGEVELKTAFSVFAAGIHSDVFVEADRWPRGNWRQTGPGVGGIEV